MILHVKPKVINVLAKTWFIKPVFNKKRSIFSLIFPLYKYFANTCIKNAQFNLFCQYMLLLTKVKQFSNLLKIKKNRSYAFSCTFPIRYVNGCPESNILPLKYPHLQFIIQTSQFYMRRWQKLLKSKHCYFLV